MRLNPIQHDDKATEKIYLGDGLYARVKGGLVWLTAENGIEVTEQVALEPNVIAALIAYLEKVRK